MNPMRVRVLAACCAVLVLSIIAGFSDAQVPGEGTRPNVIVIYVDDLGIGDVSPYGQVNIPTPRIQQLANEGMLFTQHYASSPVCATSRGAIQTGFHAGHSPIRDFGDILRPKDITLGEKAKFAGYTTGVIGKWGLGGNETAATDPDCWANVPDHSTYASSEGCNCEEWYSLPYHQGYDYFLGFINHRSAHDYYPEQVWQSDPSGTTSGSCINGSISACGLFSATPYPMPGNITIGNNPESQVEYVQELFTSYAESFIDAHAPTPDPFFLMINWTIPHRELEGPGLAPFTFNPPFNTHPFAERMFATMVNTLDTDVGRIIDRVQANGIDNNTVIIFTSDNGPQAANYSDEERCDAIAMARPPFTHNPNLYDSNGIYRGQKFDLYEAGIRVPMIVRWPGIVPPNTTTDHLSAQYDLMPTLCDMFGQRDPMGIDGITFLPALAGLASVQPVHPYLYFEYNSSFPGSSAFGLPRHAVRVNGLKYIRYENGSNELFDLSADITESNNIAPISPSTVSTIESYIADEDLGPAGDPFARVRYPNLATTATQEFFSNGYTWWNGIVPGRYAIAFIENFSNYERLYWMNISHEVLAMRVKGFAGFKMRMPFASGVTLTADNGVRIANLGQIELNNARIITKSKVELTIGSVLAGGGEIAGTVHNQGVFDVVRFWGPMNITGNFVNETVGILSHEIAGTNTSANEYDYMDVSGTFVAGGTLQILTSFAPLLGQDVKIIESAVLSGRFSSISNIAHTSTRSWAVRPVGTNIHARYSKLGDVNFDDLVNSTDLAIVNANQGVQSSWWTDGDVNGDGVVNATDAAIVTANQGI